MEEKVLLADWYLSTVDYYLHTLCGRCKKVLSGVKAIADQENKAGLHESPCGNFTKKIENNNQG
ncbi:MAG TPA: hypothetical protein VFC84_19475 [Desulfosporosinus sp.]|nr:hypothetical protein [Desulfosporosinus sp.]